MIDILIIGGDSLIGGYLKNYFLSKGKTVAITSRRSYKTDPNNFFLDLNNLSEADMDHLPRTKVVFFCAAVNGFKECLEDPIKAVTVNAMSIHAMGKKFLNDSSDLVYFSTSSIFHKNLFASEYDEPSINSVYACTKYLGEHLLHELYASSRNRLNIIRLTKLISWDAPIIKYWKQCVDRHQEIKVFTDKYISPISLKYLSEFFEGADNEFKGGTYHLSGSDLLSYFEFSKLLFDKIGWDKSLLVPHTLGALEQDGGVRLSMEHTTEKLSVQPENIDIFLNNFLG